MLASEWLNAEKKRPFLKQCFQFRLQNFSSETPNLVLEKNPKLLAYTGVLEQQKALTCAREVKTALLKTG